MTALEPSDEQAAALVRLLQEAIDGDRYPLSPRVLMLKEILGKLPPATAVAPLRGRDGTLAREPSATEPG